MMRLFVVILVSVVMLITIGCQAGDSGGVSTEAGKKVNLDTENAKASYAVGYDLGSRLKSLSESVDVKIMTQGVLDGMAGKDKAQMKPEEVMKTLRAFHQKAMNIQREKRKLLGEKNKEEGKKFLDENAKKDGIVTTKSGLQYKVITEGTGAVPKATDKVTVHYKGTLIDGTEFDSSFKRGKPATFPLNGVIPGWTEGVQLMKVGAKYQFFIPSNLAYGVRGRGQVIAPNAALIFDIELLAVEEQAAKKATPPAKDPHAGHKH